MSGSGRPSCAGEHRVDATAHRVGEEEGAVIGVGESLAVVEGDAGDRRAGPVGAGVFRRDAGAVVVVEERREAVEPGFVVEVLADLEPDRPGSRDRAHRLRSRASRSCRAGSATAGEAVDLLDVPAADVADVDLVGARVDREAEGVAKAEGDDAAGVRVGARQTTGCRARPSPVSGSTRTTVPLRLGRDRRGCARPGSAGRRLRPWAVSFSRRLRRGVAALVPRCRRTGRSRRR